MTDPRTGEPGTAAPGADFATAITVVGAGAIGSAVAYSLAVAGFAPRLVARGESLAVIRRDGLRVDKWDGGGGVVWLETSDDPRDFGPQDLVIGTMKAQDWPAALPALIPLIGPRTTLLPAINGVPWWYFDGIDGRFAAEPIRAVDPDGALLAALPASRVIGAVIYMGVSRSGPGAIRWTSGNKFVLGEATVPGGGRAEQAAAVLRRAGFDATVTADIRGEVWAKLLGNAAINPLSVIARARIDEIMADHGLGRVALAAMHEVAAVASAIGAPSRMAVEKRYAINAELGAFRTSMLQDYEAGRALELGALVDAVVEIGDRVGIATPMTAALGALARRAAALRPAAV
ncbi:MAG: ketopantoate reductase family protein [Stellaceae bacterium]